MAIFDHANPKIIVSTFSFLELVSAWKKTLFHLFIFESCDQTGPSHFWPCPPKKSLISFLFLWSCLTMQKLSLYIPSVHSSDTVNFRVPSPDWSHPFLTMLTSTMLNHLLNCVKLYQHAKNQLVLSIRFWDTVNFRV